MASKLVIVESPAKARTISKILGADYSVQSSMGHVRDLPERVLGVDLENRFEPTYRINKGRRNIIQSLNSAAKKAKAVYLATDPDREGEAIAWHLAEILKAHCGEDAFKRVTFHEITKKAVQASFDHPGTVNMELVNAQQARRVLDRIVGYKVSPLLWNNVDNKARSAGRVQSVALRLICEREAQINAFVSKEYWNFIATFSKSGDGEKFDARLHQIDSEKVDINTAADAEVVANDVVDGIYRVTKVAETPRKKRPGPPFITSTLQQAASSNLRFSTKQTMLVAQQLYEGIDTGSGLAGLITYMRTDSVNISTVARDASRDYIRERFGADYVPEKPNVYKSKKSAQEAHEAIRPTDVTMTPEMVKGFLDSRQFKLYSLIWNRFLASQMAPAQLIRHTVELENEPGSCKRNYVFHTAADRVIFPGFMRVYNLDDVEKDPEKELNDRMPKLTEKESCNLEELGKEQKFTEPPPRFSEATLVRELENNGIGRPSTYAAIVNTIQIREYVTKTKGRLQPTDLGTTVCTYLTSNLAGLFDVQFTAEMETELDQVEQGDLDWRTMLDSFYSKFTDWVGVLRSSNVPDKQNVLKLIALIPEGVTWEEPVKRGRKTFDDKKFVASLKDQIDDGKELTTKQWKALATTLVRYEEQIPGLNGEAESLGATEMIEECRTRRQEILAKESNADPATVAAGLRLCESLGQVKEWAEPVKRGNRTFDDKKFYRSLNEQAQSGKALSAAQLNALKNLLIRYTDQISDVAAVIAKLDIQEEQDDSAGSNGAIAELLLSMAKEIKTWRANDSAKKKKFDEQTFVTSLGQQYEIKKRLSDRQIYSLRRLVTSYQEQIADFETRLEALEQK